MPETRVVKNLEKFLVGVASGRAGSASASSECRREGGRGSERSGSFLPATASCIFYSDIRFKSRRNGL